MLILTNKYIIMSKNIKQKGFTLIELLVVIAIIGILSSVVITNLSSARVKATDTTIKGNLSSVRSSASIEYENIGSSYNNTGTDISGVDCYDSSDSGTIFRSVNIQNALRQIKTLNNDQALYCNVTSNAYAIVAPLKTPNTFWCIDSNGVSRDVNTSGTPYAAVTDALTDGTDTDCN